MAQSSADDLPLRPLMISATEACRLIRCSPWQLRQMARRGDVQTRKVGQRVKVIYSSLEALTRPDAA